MALGHILVSWPGRLGTCPARPSWANGAGDACKASGPLGCACALPVSCSCTAAFFASMQERCTLGRLALPTPARGGGGMMATGSRWAGGGGLHHGRGCASSKSVCLPPPLSWLHHLFCFLSLPFLRPPMLCQSAQILCYTQVNVTSFFSP